MPPFTTVEEVRAYARLNFPTTSEIRDYTPEEKAHSYVWLLCKDSMTMELLYTTLYWNASKYQYSVDPCARALYLEYLLAMKVE